MITKEETMRLKGVAILMMLFLHLFNTDERMGLCHPLVSLGDKPLVHLIARFSALCVPIYIFLSGYGLSFIYHKTAGLQMRTANRILRLYTNYWIVFLLFIPLASWVNPTEYPSDLTTLLLNVTALSDSYNLEWWFLMPYMLLVLVSPWIIRNVHALNGKQATVCCVVLMAFYLLLHPLRGMCPFFAGKDFVFNIGLLIFPFVSGIVFSHHAVLDRFRNWTTQRWGAHKDRYLWALLMVFFLLRIFIKTGAINAVYGLIFITLFTATDRNSWCNFLLGHLGKHSTNMWLTHTFFSWYLFADFFYGLQYPLLMYVVLIAVSLCTSYFIQLLNRPLQERIKRLPF